MKTKENKYLILSIIFLFIISISNLYNAKYLNVFYSDYYLKQSLWFSIGIIILLICKKLNLRNIFKYSKYLYFFNLLLLVIVLIWSDPINGTKAWINLKYFSFQPSEFMKLSLSLYLIEISLRKENKGINILKMTIITLLPSLLVFLEPDTGAIIFYLITYIYLITTKKIKWFYYLIAFISLSFLAAIFIYLYLNNQDILINYLGTSFFYRVDRFINFHNNNYQLELAMISIFGGSLIRNGFNNILIYIPEGATDFIFAFSIGNFGLIIVLLIIISYLMLLYPLFRKLKFNKNKKTNYLIISFILIIVSQSIINILMNIGLIPIIGITLPFISYGGSSLIVSFIFLGIILSLTSMDNYYNHKAYSKSKNN